jgi:plastocyanin
MKLDFSKLPIGEAIIGAVLVATFATFLAAFEFSSDAGVPAPEEPPPVDGGNGDGNGDGDGQPPPGGGLITMGDNFFEFEGEEDPAIPVAAGEEVTFDLTNDGLGIHNMRVSGDDSEYDTDDDAVSDPEIMSGGDTGTITFALAEPGEYPFRCDFHAVDMVGTIVVE